MIGSPLSVSAVLAGGLLQPAWKRGLKGWVVVVVQGSRRQMCISRRPAFGRLTNRQPNAVNL